MTHPATPEPEFKVPAELLRDVQTVLAGATEQIAAGGWRRSPSYKPGAGYRLIDALNRSSAYAAVGERAHVLAFACAAMAIELHAGIPAHALLDPAVADEYLSPETPDERLHRLDAAIVERYNADQCPGADDAYALLRRAFEIAEPVVAAQIEHGRAEQ
jgi:hypothetical protein